MLRRTAAMKFAPGAYVFPGGSVDPADYGAEVGWHGPSPAEFGARLGASAEVARALVCAAVRETFEEAGVLLAGAPGGGPLATPSGPSWDADRMAVAVGHADPRRAAVPARPRASRGPAGPVGPLDHAGRRAAPVRRAVLRGRAAGRPGGGRARGGGGPRRVAAPGGRHRLREGGGDLAAPADGDDAERLRVRRRRPAPGSRTSSARAGRSSRSSRAWSLRTAGPGWSSPTEWGTPCERDQAGLRTARPSAAWAPRGPGACSPPIRRR